MRCIPADGLSVSSSAQEESMFLAHVASFSIHAHDIALFVVAAGLIVVAHRFSRRIAER
jgi:hypothetical protein